ncbi:MAG: hypothetical protein WCJ70_02445 [bacterium]
MDNALATCDPAAAAEWLRRETALICKFNEAECVKGAVNGLFCIDTISAIRRVYEAKERPLNKALVQVGTTNSIARYLNQTNQRINVSLHEIDIAHKMLLAAERAGEQIGIYVRAGQSEGPELDLFNYGVVPFSFGKLQTYGFMATGKGDFAQVAAEYEKGSNRLPLRGTSCNVSNDKRSHGSGISHMDGVIEQMGSKGGVTIFSSLGFEERTRLDHVQGPVPSTTVFALGTDPTTGDVHVRHHRDGSLSLRAIQSVLQGENGVVTEFDSPINILPYESPPPLHVTKAQLSTLTGGDQGQLTTAMSLLHRRLDGTNVPAGDRDERGLGLWVLGCGDMNDSNLHGSDLLNQRKAVMGIISRQMRVRVAMKELDRAEKWVNNHAPSRYPGMKAHMIDREIISRLKGNIFVSE